MGAKNSIMVLRMGDGFIIVMTYGRDVDWPRNLPSAGHGSLVWYQRAYHFQQPQLIDVQTASTALPPLIRSILRLRGEYEYVKRQDKSVA